MVEFAVTLPLLLIIFAGVVECTQTLRTKSSVTVAAYEAARLAAHQEVTSARVRSRCISLLQEFAVEEFDVSVSPSLIRELPTGTPITVTVSAKRNGSFLNSFLRSNVKITKTSTMLRE